MLNRLTQKIIPTSIIISTPLVNLQEKQNFQKKIKTVDVIQKENHRIPAYIIQDEKIIKEEKEAARGMLKAAVLKGDNKITDLLCFSIYDSKSYYFMTNHIEDMKWKQVKKKNLVKRTLEKHRFEFYAA